MRGLRWLTAVLLLGCVAEAAALDVLCPPEGYRPAGDQAWLVVASPSVPEVRIDGRVAAPALEADGFYHLRIEAIQAGGSTVEVTAGEVTVRRTVGGVGAAEPIFHAAPPDACRSCHDLGADGCTTCHRWRGAKHEPLLAQGCERCHEAPEWRARRVAELCAACHADYADGRHPRLRHAVRAARDPSRPGRPLDCASCHDPHAPRCLSCLGRGELRDWCRGCHGRS